MLIKKKLYLGNSYDLFRVVYKIKLPLNIKEVWSNQLDQQTTILGRLRQVWLIMSLNKDEIGFSLPMLVVWWTNWYDQLFYKT